MTFECTYNHYNWSAILPTKSPKSARPVTNHLFNAIVQFIHSENPGKSCGLEKANP